MARSTQHKKEWGVCKLSGEPQVQPHQVTNHKRVSLQWRQMHWGKIATLRSDKYRTDPHRNVSEDIPLVLASSLLQK